MTEEWGPIIEHDGQAVSVPVGFYVQAWKAHGGRGEGAIMASAANPGPGQFSLWIWSTLPYFARPHRILRYRIRRPRGMEVLDRCLAQLPPDPPQGDQPAPRPAEPVPAEGVEA